jgi:hypothetical protein
LLRYNKSSVWGIVLYKTFGLLSIALSLLLSPRVNANPSFQVLSGQATLSRNAALYQAQKGVKLYEGDSLFFTKLKLIGDYGAFVSTLQYGQATITLLRREGCGYQRVGIRNLIEYKGKLWVIARPKTCPTSTVQFQSQMTGVSFDIWRGALVGQTDNWIALSQGKNVAVLPEPTGVSARFWDKGNATYLMVDYGTVSAESAGVSIPVSGGYGNITLEGLAPGQLIKVETDLRIKKQTLTKALNGVLVSVWVNPLNTVIIQGIEYTPMDGQVKAFLRYPIAGNAVWVLVSDTEKTRIYPLPLPTRK